MNKHQTSRLLAIIAAAYPRFEVDDTTLNVWSTMLSDIGYSVCEKAAAKYIMTQTWPPSIAEIRKECVKLLYPALQTTGEAWASIEAAIREHGLYGEKEAKKNMAPEVQRAVEAIGWDTICRSENISVVRGQYIKIYETYIAQIEEARLLPVNMRKQIESKETKLLEGKGVRSDD